MNTIFGREAFLALLESEGVTHLFGNPGTTELPIMAALPDRPAMTYVMALQERWWWRWRMDTRVHPVT